MGNIIHLAVDTERSGTGVGRERGDDRSRFGAFFVRGAETAIYRRDLVSVQRDPASQAIAARAAAIGPGPRRGAALVEERVDGRPHRLGPGHEHDGARHTPRVDPRPAPPPYGRRPHT